LRKGGCGSEEMGAEFRSWISARGEKSLMKRSQRTFPKGSRQRSNLQCMLRIIMMSRSSDRAVGTRASRVLGLLLLNGDGEFLLVGGGEDGEDGSEGIHLRWFGGWREEEKVEGLRRVW
jgi:hypothetical protein